MPSISTISLDDSVPTAHSYTPVRIGPEMAYLTEKVGAPFQNPELRLSIRQPIGNGIYKVRLTLAIPKVDDIDGVLTLDYTDTCHVDFLLHERSTELRRQDLLAQVISALQHANVSDTVEKLEGPY